MNVRILSTLGMKCPRPLFEVHKNIRLLAVGDRLEVSADDPAFKPDVEAWCRRTGHTLVDLRSESDRVVALIQREEH